MISSLCTSHGQLVRKAGAHLVTGVLVALCAVNILLLLLQMTHLFLLEEAGYGDSYIFYDVVHFQKTGVLYRDLSQPPYLPALYSPMVYILYSLPGRIATGVNPFVGPRLVAVTAFLLCVGIVISIARALIPARLTWLWAMLLACSITSMSNWILQIRGDFPGICLGLMTIRLLLSRSRWAVPLAGICAGLAMQFKITFVAAFAAGAVWLALRRRWKEGSAFIAMGALSSIGLYFLFSIREPRMFVQISTLSHALLDVRGGLKFMYHTATEPVVLLAVLGVPPIGLYAWPRWSLLHLFAMASFTIASVTDFQVGANINYFFETFFALTPLAVLGVLRLTAVRWRRVALGVFIAALLCIQFLNPRAVYLYQSIRERFATGPNSIRAREKAIRALEQELRGEHIFSTVPRLALLDANPALLEPTMTQTLGTASPQPVLKRIREAEFDIVITPEHLEFWRGTIRIPSDIRNAIVHAYKPQCVLLGWEIHLPRAPRPGTSELAHKLTNINCVTVTPNQSVAN